MKAFAFVLLCALVAVQGRYTALDDDIDDSLAAKGENPWLVHLRVAVSTSGQLNTGIGSLISDRWVLTTASNVADARFVWLGLGVVSVNSPSLVIETTLVRINPDYNATTGENNIGLVNSTRPIGSDPHIKPIALAGAIAGPGTVCIFGPRGVLHCFHINVARDDSAGLVISGGAFQVTPLDYGTPVVNGDGQIGLLVGPGSEGSVGEFVAADFYFDWIQFETGIVLNPGPLPDDPAQAVHVVQ